MKSLRVVCGLSLIVAIALGCNRDGKYPVSGTVSFDGEPVAEGNIVFTPDDESLAPDGGLIVDGSFEFRASAGSKKIKVFAVKDVGQADRVMNIQRREQFIPEQYNDKTELVGEVKPGGDNTFTLNLERAKKK